jgi:predicted metalloprotease
MGVAPVAVGGGIGTIVLALIVMFLGGDPSIILNQGVQVSTNNPQVNSSRRRSPEEDRSADFVATVLADTEDTWPQVLRENGRNYVQPKLVLFTGSVESACGYAKAAMGPFYCPRDQKVYIDLSFFQDLRNRHNAPGDFAQAYVVAHEIGHHVQNLLGILPEAHKAQSRLSKEEANRVSVMIELQADCFAGVWANRAQQSRQILEPGDIEEGINAASQIGDDRLQSQAQGYVVPDSFTHGSSAQRVRWFKQGLKTGDINQCNTFEARNL